MQTTARPNPLFRYSAEPSGLMNTPGKKAVHIIGGSTHQPCSNCQLWAPTDSMKLFHFDCTRNIRKCRIRNHLFIIVCISDPFYLFCNTRETVKQFLLECPQYCFDKCFLHESCATLNIPFSLGNVFTEPCLLSSVVEFANACDKYL